LYVNEIWFSYKNHVWYVKGKCGKN
jgi:hypothetical protein